MKFVVKSFFMLCFAVIGSYVVYHIPIRENVNMQNIDLDKYKNLMIVAHPDDDMLWGGAHLIEDDYVVVCITCGSNSRRLNEFRRVMQKTDDSYIALGYPDTILRNRNDWKYFSDYIIKDLEKIISSNDWNLVVTHNKSGEYGHIHHKMTNKFVTDIYNESDASYELYYFGDYYSKKKIVGVEEELIPISDEVLEEKLEIIDLYVSQIFVKDKFEHMMRYEMWEKYNGE